MNQVDKCKETRKVLDCKNCYHFSKCDKLGKQPPKHPKAKDKYENPFKSENILCR